MNRLDITFDRLRQSSEKALITYITAGDPDLDFSLKMMHTLADQQVDILEIGFPFSEPMADGPVIQRAIERSLQSGTTLAKVLNMVAEFRKENQSTPVVLMGYLNPVLSLGYHAFAERAAMAGVDGVLIVDCPVEAVDELHHALTQRSIASIFLVTPTTSLERVKMAARYAGGFLYYVSLKGVTGSAKFNAEEVIKKLEEIKSAVTIPLVVGFGIKDPESVRAVSEVADGVVVGSRMIEAIENSSGSSLENVIELVKALKGATRVR